MEFIRRGVTEKPVSCPLHALFLIGVHTSSPNTHLLPTLRDMPRHPKLLQLHQLLLARTTFCRRAGNLREDLRHSTMRCDTALASKGKRGYVCIYLYIYIHVYRCVYTCMYKHRCKCQCICIYIYINHFIHYILCNTKYLWYMHICIHVYMYARLVVCQAMQSRSEGPKMAS